MDTLDRIRREINDRLVELRPVVREFERLQRAHAALEASRATHDTATRSVRGAGDSGGQRRRTTPRGSARERILAAARDDPEAKRGDIARVTGLSPNTVGSTLSKLRAEGLLPRPRSSRAGATSDIAAEPGEATDTAIAEPSPDAGSAAPGDEPQGEFHPTPNPEHADQPEATSEPGEGKTATAEPPKRKATKGRLRPAKAPSG